MAGNRGTLCWSSWGRVYFGEQMPPVPYVMPDDAGGTTAYSCYGDPTLPEELSCLHRAENDKVLTVKPSKRLKGGLSFS